MREKYCWLVTGGWFVLSEKYCRLVADKPNEQADTTVVRKRRGQCNRQALRSAVVVVRFSLGPGAQDFTPTCSKRDYGGLRSTVMERPQGELVSMRDSGRLRSMEMERPPGGSQCRQGVAVLRGAGPTRNSSRVLLSPN
jgi:hypothetical protein